MRNQILFFSDVFSKASLDELVPRFIANLQQWCADHKDEVSSDWTEKPDLFDFIRRILFTCNMDSFFGKYLRELNPTLEDDFMEYDAQVPFLATGMPTWLKPGSTKARNRCQDAMRRWREHAVETSLNSNVPEDAAWDPVWGMAAIRRRNKLLDATNGLFDEQNRTSIDLALMWT